MAIGVTFRPDEQKKNDMARRGGSQDGVQRAIQLLSLRYPKFGGGRSPVGDPALLAGNAPRIGGFNPDAAILQAMIKALSGGGGASVVADPMGTPRGNTPGARVGGMPRTARVPSRTPSPVFTPGVDPIPLPVPTGTATREWEPPLVSEPLRTMSGDPTGAARRSSGGYSPFKSSPWTSERNFY